MDFSKIKSLLIPQGKVKSLSIGGVKVWSEYVQSSSGSEGLKYELTTTSGETYYVCTGFPYGKEVEDVVVASEINGIPVKAIGYEAFYNDNIKSVTLPDSVTHTYARAFRGCTSLERIVGKGLESIGAGAFWDCSALEVVEISSKLKGIEGDSFRNCISLTEFNIPISVTWVGSYSFSGCTNLTIYCEAESQPSGWSEDWNYDLTNSTYIDVVWGSTEEPEEDELQGLWLWNGNMALDLSKNSVSTNVNFQSNGTNYNSIEIKNSEYIKYGSTIVGNGSVNVMWSNESYCYINITSKLAEVTNGELLLDWLKLSGQKVEDPLKGNWVWGEFGSYVGAISYTLNFMSNGVLYDKIEFSDSAVSHKKYIYFCKGGTKTFVGEIDFSTKELDVLVDYQEFTILDNITDIVNGYDLLYILKECSLKQSLAPEYQFTLLENGSEHYGQITTCTFRQGMTWQEWVDSDYNTTDIASFNGYISTDGFIITLNSTFVKTTDFVQVLQYVWVHGDHTGGNN